MVRKRGVQALVEFATVEEAARALAVLDGAQIYEGCCTLKVQYSRAERLNIKYNSDETRDYTTPPQLQSTASLKAKCAHSYPSSLGRATSDVLI